MNAEMTYRFVIWGTGHYSRVIVDYLEQLENAFPEFIYYIDAFIDTDERKQLTEFCERIVYSPNYINNIDNQIIIISMRDYRETESYLINKGISNYITSYELLFEESLAQDLLRSIGTVETKGTSSLILRNRLRKQIRENIVADILLEQKLPYKYQLSAVMSECGEDFNRAERYINDYETRSLNINSDIEIVGIYYSRLYSGGVERVISKLIPMFIKKGFHIVLFTHSITEMDYDLPKDVERCVIPYDPLMPCLWIEQFYEELINRNIDVLINHAHAVWRSYYLGVLCTKLLGIKYLIESHTCIGAITSQGREAFYKRIYSLADSLIVLSEKDRAYWRASISDVRYIPNPIERANVEQQQEYSDTTILWVGRIDVQEKNVLDVVPVMKEVSSIIPNVKLYLIGHADEKNVLEDLVKKINENKLEDSICIEGYVKEVGHYYENAALIFFTSPYEGFPMAMAEAMSYGVPVVMYDIDGLELSKSGWGVLSVKQRDYSSLAKRIIEVLRDPVLRKRLSDEAKMNIERFAHIDIAEEWKKVICNMI